MEYEGDFVDSANQTETYIESLLLTYPLKLAATGAGIDATPVLAGGLALAAFGGLLALGARRRRSA
jgi:LPXTG-motif cell wall-anchored protein